MFSSGLPASELPTDQGDQSPGAKEGQGAAANEQGSVVFKKKLLKKILETTLDAQKFAKIAQRGLVYLSPGFPDSCRSS